MILIDMHIHSNHSDGTLDVESIVRMAKRRRLSLVSLTDHDTTEGLASFMASCRKQGITGLSGIELSAESHFTLHILGYRIDALNDRLQRGLAEIRENRGERNLKICKKLRDLGFDIEIEDAVSLSKGQVVARPHIARLMMHRGYVSSFGEAFAKYIGSEGSAYVPRDRFSAEECISLITEAGGLAVLAHPAQTLLDDGDMDNLLSDLKNKGLWGIEALYSGHSPEETYKYLRMAEKYELYPTAGSDFHGIEGRGIEIGIVVSEDFLPWARLGVKI